MIIQEITDRQDAAETARRWGMTKRRVLQLCREGKVYAAKMVDGKWTIPTAAVRPVDGRQNRAKHIPDHLRTVLDYADAAVRDVPERERKWSDDAFEYFLRGSAYHMHMVKTSHLTFSDVCNVLEGKAVGGKPLFDQMQVVYHKRAIRFIAAAIRDGRRLSVRLIEELHGLLQCGSRYHREPMKQRRRVDDSVKRVRNLNAHPIWKAADFFVRFLVLNPYSRCTEVTAYLIANFILMSNGYPPIIVFRAVFRWWDMKCWLELSNGRFFWKRPGLADNWGNFLDGNFPDRMPEEIERLKAGTIVDPTIFAGLFAKAIRRSCRRGLMRAIPKCERLYW